MTFIWKLCSKIVRYFYVLGKILRALPVSNYLIFTATFEVGTDTTWGKKI